MIFFLFLHFWLLSISFHLISIFTDCYVFSVFSLFLIWLIPFSFTIPLWYLGNYELFFYSLCCFLKIKIPFLESANSSLNWYFYEFSENAVSLKHLNFNYSFLNYVLFLLYTIILALQAHQNVLFSFYIINICLHLFTYLPILLLFTFFCCLITLLGIF